MGLFTHLTIGGFIPQGTPCRQDGFVSAGCRCYRRQRPQFCVGNSQREL